MKKSVLVLIGALLVSNALWGAVFFVTRGTFERSPAERFRLYTMSGTGEQWDVTNYTVVASSEWDDKEGNMHTEIIALKMMNEVVIGKGA